VLNVSPQALREGCDRANDLFTLSRLQGIGAGGETLSAVMGSLGLDETMRADLEHAVVDLLPIKGVPSLEATAAAAMLSGVLVGLLIADSTLPPGDELDLPVAPD
jgi:hypothetical protein